MTLPHWVHTLISFIFGASAMGVALWAGILDAAGKWIFDKWLQPVFDRIRFLAGFGKMRKRKRRTETNMIKIIAGLKQKVTDQGKQLNKLEKVQIQVSKRLEACQAERTECRADLRNVLMRVSALERGKSHA